MSQENNAYVLGTDREELHRLGFQHQVWSSETRIAWERAGFGPDQVILDLGSGPGFCAIELAYMVGQGGQVIAVDKSEQYINFLNQRARNEGLIIESICADFHELPLQDNSLDGIYSRWALAWVDHADQIIEKLSRALKPGGVFVAQEYYNWYTFQSEPAMPWLLRAKEGILKSFELSPGDIDIGRYLPGFCEASGLEVISTRPMAKLAFSEDMTWQWPKTFLEIYLPKLVEMGILTEEIVSGALDEVDELEDIPGSSILCPIMIEVIAVKT